MTKFDVTYQIVTPESAEHGDYAEEGMEMEGVPLRQVWDFVRWGCEGGIEANEWPVVCPRYVSFYGIETSYVTGATKSVSVHFPRNITPSSARRVARLLGAR